MMAGGGGTGARGIKFTPDANTVLWLPGQDDAYSATIRDRSGFNNHGTITGATWTRLPSGLWAQNFTAQGQFITVADVPSLSAFTAITVELWIKTGNTTNYGNLASKYYQSTLREWNLMQRQTGAPGAGARFDVYDQSANANIGVYSNDQTKPVNNVWTHMVATWSGGNYTTMAMYFNGIAETLVDGTGGTFVAVEDLAVDVVWGRQQNLTARDYVGQQALQRIYNRALSPSEVLSHYQQERYLIGV